MQSLYMDFVYRSRKMTCRSRWGKSSLPTWTLCTGLRQWYLAHDGEKVVSVHGLCVPVQDNGLQLTMGKKQSPCVDFVDQSMTMVSRSRRGKISLCTWTLCTGLGKWYVAQDKKIVVSVHGLCVPVQDNGMQRTIGKGSLCKGTLCTGLGQWYVAHDGEKVVSIHGLCVLMQGNCMQRKMGKKWFPCMDFVYWSRRMTDSSRWGKIISMCGLCVPVQDNGMYLTMGKKQSPCMDFVYQSNKMVCSAILEESSLRSWTLCAGLGKQYIAHIWEK